MTAAAFDRQLLERFGSARVRPARPLAPMTTFKVGGPADWLIDLHDAAELRDVLAIADAHGIHVAVLGGGSNVLVSDAGIRGLVVRLRGGDVARIADDRIRADAGVTINGLVRWTISHGLAGLEAWAGTPGTVGGAMLRQRALSRPADRRARRRRDARHPRRPSRRRPGSGAWSSATTTAGCSGPARSSCRRTSSSGRAIRRRCARSRGSRWRSASARSRSSRRAPAASSRTPTRRAIRCRTAFRGRPARSSIAPG